MEEEEEEEQDEENEKDKEKDKEGDLTLNKDQLLPERRSRRLKSEVKAISITVSFIYSFI